MKPSISRLPEVEGDKPAKRKIRSYPIGYFHIDIAEVRTAEGKLYLFVAIDRASKFAFVELHERATRRVAADFLRHLTATVPYKVHTVLTDNGTHFTAPTGYPSGGSRLAEGGSRLEDVLTVVRKDVRSDHGTGDDISGTGASASLER